jgi:UDP-N-acetylglucosamine:LPS N-acetylglucosamine transferase
VTEERADVLLVCSSGGHLVQMLALREAWGDFSRVWVTADTSDARSLMAGERMVAAHGPAHRSVRKLLLNLVLAWQLITVVRPKIVLSTGAAIAVPFVWVARLRGIEVIHIESLTRIHKPSLSGRLIAPAATRIYVQWPELGKAMSRSRYVGSVVSLR